MGIRKIDELNELHIDLLREIGNIGSGNAATSLSQMLNRDVDMTVPVVKLLDISDVASSLGGPEHIVVGILGKLYGDIDGIMVFIIEQDFAQLILQNLLGESIDKNKPLTEMQLSAVSEIGNIMISSYINSIATLSSLDIHTSVPSICIDMVGAILTVSAVEMNNASDKVIFIEENFLTKGNNISANVMLLPELESLTRLMKRLGIDL